ncbi:MAG: hypothetical protein V4547_16915 [Bacteroidota bacterium]
MAYPKVKEDFFEKTPAQVVGEDFFSDAPPKKKSGGTASVGGSIGGEVGTSKAQSSTTTDPLSSQKKVFTGLSKKPIGSSTPFSTGEVKKPVEEKPDNSIFNPKNAIKSDVRELDSQELKEYKARQNDIQTGQQTELVDQIKQERSNPKQQRKLAEDYINEDMQESGHSPIVDQHGLDVPQYFNTRKQEIKSQIETIRANMDERGLVSDMPDPKDVKELNRLNQKLGELNKYSNIYNQQRAVNDVNPSLPQDEQIKQVGRNLRKVNELDKVQKEESDDYNGIESEKPEVKSIRNFNDEVAGINALKNKVYEDLDNGAIDETQAKSQLQQLKEKDNALDEKYPKAALESLRGLLSEDIAKTRKQSNADAPTNSGGNLSYYWNNIISAAPSKTEIQDAVDRARKSGAKISNDQVKELMKDPDKFSLTSVLGHLYHGSVVAADQALNNWIGNDKSEREKYFKDASINQMEQPTELPTINEDGKVRMAVNEKAGEKNPLGWGTLNNMAEVGGTIANYILLNKGMGAVAESALGGIAGAEVTGVGKGLKEVTKLTAEQKNLASNVMSSTFLNYHHNKEYAKTLTDDENEQEAYAVARSLITGLAFSELNPNKIISGVSEGTEKNIAEKFIEQYKSGKGTLNPDGMKKWFADAVIQTGKDLGHNVTTIKADQLAGIALDKLTNKEKFEDRNVMEEMTGNLASDVLAFAPFSAIAGYQKSKANAGVRNAVKMAISDPIKFESDMMAKVQDGTIKPEDAQQKIGYIKELVKTSGGADMKSEKVQALPENDQFNYAANLAKESNLKAKSKDLTDKVQIYEHKKDINELADERKAIINGKHDEYLKTAELFDRAYEKGTHNTTLDAGTKTEGVKYLSDQALTTPQSLKNQTKGDKELITDLIALNPKHEIKAEIKSWKDKQNPDNTQTENEVPQKNIDLLEAALEKQSPKKVEEVKAEPEKEVVNPKEKFPLPSKPVDEMNASELDKHIEEVKDFQKKTKLPKEQEDALTGKDADEYFGKDLPEGGVYDHTELQRIRNRVSLIEQAETLKDISETVKRPLIDYARKQDTENLAVIKAAKRKADELGISTEDFAKSINEQIKGEFKTDADAMSKIVFDAIETTKPTDVVGSEVGEDVIINKDNIDKYINHLKNGGKLAPSDLIDLRYTLRERHKAEQNDLFDKVQKEGGKHDDAFVYSKNPDSEGRELGKKQREEMDLIDNQPNSYGLKGDINAETTYHFTDPTSLLNILDENSLYGEGEVSGVSTTTNKGLGHPELSTVQQYGEGNKPLTFADKGIVIELDLQKLKKDGIKIKEGKESLGTFVGEEELKIGGYEGIKELNKYIKQIEVDKKILDQEPVTSAYHISFEDIKKAAEKHGIKVVEKTDYERPRNKLKSENKPLLNEGKEATENTKQAEGVIESEKVVDETTQPTGGEKEGGKKTAGIAQSVQEKRRDILGATPYEKGQGWNKEQALANGKEMADNGMEVADIFKRFAEDGRVSPDEMSRLQWESVRLAKETQKVGDEFGVDSPEYKAALKNENEFLDQAQPLKTASSKTFTAQQGEIDLDTDSFTAVRKAAVDAMDGKPLSKEQEAKIKDLVAKNEELKKRAEEAEKLLIEAMDKAMNEGDTGAKKPSIKEKAKKTADIIRKLKTTRPDTFSSGNVVWDGAVEVVAKTIELGGSIADAIAKGIEHIKESDWYKGLSKDKKDEVEKDFTNVFAEEKEINKDQLEELQKMFVDKAPKDTKFSIEEAKAIWEYAKEQYINRGISFRDMIAHVAEDLGLTWKQASTALTSKKTERISDEMWKASSERIKNQNATKNWIEAQNKSIPFKMLRKVSAAFRGVAVFGHGGIFIGTHAGMTLFNPSQWKVVIPAFIRGWKFAYGNTGKYERRIEQLRNDRNYIKAQRAGLKNNPDNVNTEEFQKSQQIFDKIGGNAGVKGFNAIKVLRQDIFNLEYDKLSAAEQNDPASLEQIAKLANNATGATNLKMPAWVDEVSFAGGMEAARWGKLTRNPMRATAIAFKALAQPEKATTAERVFAKVWARRVGEQLGTMAGMMIANAAIQSIVNPKNPTNLTDPDKPDFMKFKFGDLTIDPTSGMRGTGMFIYALGKIPFMDKKERRGDTPVKYAGKSIAGYTRGKLAPLYGTIADFFDQQDFNRNPMPFSDEKPAAGHHKLTWSEYAWQKAPLPIAHAAGEMYKAALDHNGGSLTTKHVVDGIIAGILSGGTGFRIGEYNAVESDHSPYNEKDKQDPTFKYFLDKGLELPNTSLSSEVITDNKNMTKKKVSEYSKEIQERYTNTHKEYLKKELADIKKKGVVYTKEYLTSDGEKKVEVYTDKKPNSTRKKIDDLSTEELAQVLSRAQSQATKLTKKKIFNQK